MNRTSIDWLGRIRKPAEAAGIDLAAGIPVEVYAKVILDTPFPKQLPLGCVPEGVMGVGFLELGHGIDVRARVAAVLEEGLLGPSGPDTRPCPCG